MSRLEAVRAWTSPPDVVSLDLDADGVIELGGALVGCGIGIEAGVFTLDGADALLAAPWAPSIHRVLVEVIYEHEDRVAVNRRLRRTSRPRRHAHRPRRGPAPPMPSRWP